MTDKKKTTYIDINSKPGMRYPKVSKEIYANVIAYAYVFMDISKNVNLLGRIELELFDATPKTSEKFQRVAGGGSDLRGTHTSLLSVTANFE